MSKPTFTWNPDLGASRTVTPRVTVVKFGDGYEQRMANGINPVVQVWQLTFTRDQQEAMEIDSFLAERKSVESFLWTTPHGFSGTFVCRQWTVSRQSFGVFAVTATFEQVFEF